MSGVGLWIVVIATGVVCFVTKLLGHVVPQRWLAHPRLQRVNALVPLALLSALVVAQSVVVHARIVIDHRLAGLCVAVAALWAKLPFLVVVVGAAVTSALVVHLAG